MIIQLSPSKNNLTKGETYYQLVCRVWNTSLRWCIILLCLFFENIYSLFHRLLSHASQQMWNICFFLYTAYLHNTSCIQQKYKEAVIFLHFVIKKTDYSYVYLLLKWPSAMEAIGHSPVFLRLFYSILNDLHLYKTFLISRILTKARRKRAFAFG